MNKSITAISISLFLVACGGSGSEGLNKGADSSAPGLGAALPDATDSRSLEITKEFGFETARSVDVEFDIAAARQADASVSICTDYTPLGSEFDVDFDSCTVSGTLDNGAFSHTIDITNDKDSVVGIVLFQDAEIAPMYKEFTVDENQRTKSDGSAQRVLVWK